MGKTWRPDGLKKLRAPKTKGRDKFNGSAEASTHQRRKEYRDQNSQAKGQAVFTDKD